MSQLAIYIDDELAQRLDRAAKESGKSKSKWVTDVIERSLNEQWPTKFFDLAGVWEGEASPEELIKKIRRGVGDPEQREELFR